MTGETPSLAPWRAVAAALKGASGFALLDFPQNPDGGDHAAWLGETKAFAAAGLREPVYACSAESYDPAALKAALNGGALVFHGRTQSPRRGGSADPFLARVLTDFPGTPTVLLPRAHPQPVALAGLRDAAGDRALTLFASSEEERTWSMPIFGAFVANEIVPGFAAFLGPRTRPADPAYDVIWLARTGVDGRDAETESAARLASQGVEKFPLPAFADGIEMSFVVKQRPPTVLLTDWPALVFDSQEARLGFQALPFAARAEACLARADRLLSLGHIVVTDRIEAYLLAAQLSVPSILVDTPSGANADYDRAWGKPSPACHLAATPQEAWALARDAAQTIKDTSDKG